MTASKTHISEEGRGLWGGGGDKSKIMKSVKPEPHSSVFSLS